jgi:hypothetical protein
VWTYASLAGVLAGKTGYGLSTSEVGRILRFDEIAPHLMLSGCTARAGLPAEGRGVCDLCGFRHRDHRNRFIVIARIGHHSRRAAWGKLCSEVPKPFGLADFVG